jgi:putative endonuclease
MTMDTYHKGLLAELWVMVRLMLKGYRILHWRYKTKVGEIDIIARRGDVTAFIEVKQRGSLDDALFSLTPAMRRRISQAARYYMSKGAGRFAGTLRFDLVAVSGFSVRHLDNAWQDAP